MPGAVWFEDTQLNFAENLLARGDDHVALVFCNERGSRRQLAYRQLRAEVARLTMERDIAKKAAAYFALDVLQSTPGSKK